MNSELKHFGVKGMRWGVRRKKKSSDRKLKKQQKKWDKRVESDWHQAYNKTGNKLNPFLDSLNKKFENKDVRDYSKGIGKQYFDAYRKQYGNIYASELKNMFGNRPGEQTNFQALAKKYDPNGTL